MKRWLVALLFAVIISILHQVIFYSAWGERIEPLMLDFWARIVGPRETPRDIVIVAMDERSYQDLNIPLSQPWPRKLHAALLDRLAEAKAKRVAFDILFIDESLDPKADEALAKSIKKVPVVLGAESVTHEQAGAAGTFRFDSLPRPYKPFEDGATLGIVTNDEDDGYVRRFYTKRNSATQGLLTLAEAAAGFSASETVRPKERDLINFYGPPSTIDTVSYSQVLDKDHPIPPNIFENKIVYVGLLFKTEVGPAQKDAFSTSYGRLFGLEIHATATLNLLHKDWIRRSSKGLEAFVLGICSLVLCTLMFGLRPISGGILLAGWSVAWLTSSYVGLVNLHFIPGVIFTAVFMPLSFLGSTLYYYFVTRRAQLKMESAFQLYVSPEVAHQVAGNQGALKLGGEKVWATALFTDIAGFTSITEDLPAEKVSAMLNAYFTEVMDVIFQNQGTLSKFIGDAVFVFWGAPIRINDHAMKACQTALAISREVERFNKSGRFAPLHTRIGINTGPMVVGNLGSERRFDYTAIGDSVNLASRVEGINKYFGTDILITETVKKEIGNSFHTLSVGSIKVAGKREAVELHALFPEPLPQAITTLWTEALADYRARRWEESEGKFNKVMEMAQPLKKAALLYERQIASFRAHPPSDEWLGEVTFTEK